jgi:hypothetical protein
VEVLFDVKGATSCCDENRGQWYGHIGNYKAFVGNSSISL